jgi:hypothetical protein
MAPALRLKYKQYSMMYKSLSLFLCTQILVYVIIPVMMINSSEDEQEIYDRNTNIFQHFCEVIMIGVLMVVFRPRVWPDFYTLGILESPLVIFSLTIDFWIE